MSQYIYTDELCTWWRPLCPLCFSVFLLLSLPFSHLSPFLSSTSIGYMEKIRMCECCSKTDSALMVPLQICMLPIMPCGLMHPWTLAFELCTETKQMVRLLFSPEDTLSLLSKQNLKCWLVWPQDSFPFPTEGSSISGSGLYTVSCLHGRVSSYCPWQNHVLLGYKTM